MSFENTKIIDPYVEAGRTPEIRLFTATPDDVRMLEQKLSTPLPNGYAEYVTTLGRGLYCNFVRVFTPAHVLDNLDRHKRFLNEYWFWELGEDNVISKEKALKCLHLADTVNGDYVIFDSVGSGDAYLLPESEDLSYKIGSDFYEAMDWLWRNQPGTKEVTGYPEIHYFVPENPRVFTDGWMVPKVF